MNIREAIQIGPKFMSSGTAVEFVSGPGLGKSSMVYAIAAMMSRLTNRPFGVMTMICSGMDPADVRGFIFPLKDEAGGLHARFTRPIVFPSLWNIDVWVDGKLDRDYLTREGAVQMPTQGIVFLDEFGQAEMEVQKPLGQFILDKRIGEYRLNEGWVVWAASNRIGDMSGVVKRAMFLQNRMKTINIEGSLQAWLDWAMKAGIHPLAVSFANKHWPVVHRESVPKEQGPFASPRSFILCVEDLLAMREKEHGDTRLPDDHLATEVIQGWLGEGAAAQFVTHIRLANDLPEISDVARNPKGTKVPDRIDAQYVMASILPHHINNKNAGAFVTYIDRFPDELQILFVTQSIARGPQTLNVPEFQAWVMRKKALTAAAFG